MLVHTLPIWCSSSNRSPGLSLVLTWLLHLDNTMCIEYVTDFTAHTEIGTQ